MTKLGPPPHFRPPRRVILQSALQGLGAMMVGCGIDQRTLPGADASAPIQPKPAKSDAPLPKNLGEIGPLEAADGNHIRLPKGFSSRVVARGGSQPVEGSPYAWHRAPDGGATFTTSDGGWIYVSNCEESGTGGAGALRFDSEGTIIDAYSILSNTYRNCSGGSTPQGTWLSCEEVPKGRVLECDPFGKKAAIERLCLGVFSHEATVHDLVNQHVYLTEDEIDGGFYRFLPEKLDSHGYADLSSGRLQVAEVSQAGEVLWHDVPDPSFVGDRATRYQVSASTKFNGGEGIWWHEEHIYFSTKGDDRIWDYDVRRARLRILYDAWTAAQPILTGVDCLIGSAAGELLVAEDAGDMQVIVILPDGTLKPLLQIVGQLGSEVTGLAFDPSGTRMYFSSQRAATTGITYEVTGPFHDTEV